MVKMSKKQHLKNKQGDKFILGSVADEINDPLDLFDSLPPNVQKNHKLLTAFCHWYPYSRHDELIRWIRWIHDIIRIKKEQGWDKSP
jgi:hypothetical protein